MTRTLLYLIVTTSFVFSTLVVWFVTGEAFPLEKTFFIVLLALHLHAIALNLRKLYRWINLL